ncbi:sensor histidine kinase [Paenibacillus soyae]|uniref:Sensor histidine kinase n=1 Tax=Paenibacillus soyae TaxID=2969249 RepID=A0A9X2S890_9BACL|nr:sensor histidine kinase [Paenibacillus soyae]MCR2803826.1 sensor histidine kinase [Paenibacillus soyae]
MRRRLREIPWRTIRVKLVLGLLGITLPLIILLLYNNAYSVNVIHNQVAVSNKNLVSVYMKQIDDQLSEAERHMMGLLMSEYNMLALGEAATEDDYVMAKSAISRRIASDLIVYPYIDGFFVYSLPRKDIVEAARYPMSYDELVRTRGLLKEQVELITEQPVYLSAGWTAHRMNGESVLLRIFGESGIYIGAWVKAESMLKPLQVMQTGETGANLIVGEAGEPLYSTRPLAEEKIDFTQGFDRYYLSGEDKNYLVVGEPSSKGEFSLAAVVPDKLILENLPYLSRAAWIVVAIALIMLPLSLWFLRKVLLLPLQKMTKAMRRLGEGNLHAKLEVSTVPDEFQLVNQTFNQMISQIEELKINVYEEQLSKQRAELKHLQLQINPHFFMNSLNILYNLAQVKQYGFIQELTLCLVHYFRYMLQSNRPLVLLSEELKHTRNFLRIQQLRFPKRLTCDYHVPDYLGDTQIPPLLLQTFAENVIKHALRSSDSVNVTIDAALEEHAEEPVVVISVRDSGPGFSDEALESIRLGRRPSDEKAEHIGLWNARERLRLQYGERAWMECYNREPRGAAVEIGIPMRSYARGEDDGNAAVVDRG